MTDVADAMAFSLVASDISYQKRVAENGRLVYI